MAAYCHDFCRCFCRCLRVFGRDDRDFDDDDDFTDSKEEINLRIHFVNKGECTEKQEIFSYYENHSNEFLSINAQPDVECVICLGEFDKVSNILIFKHIFYMLPAD